MNMINFRNDMIKFSQKYPFIKLMQIDHEAWLELCASFDRQLGLEEGHTANNIASKSTGLMKFENIKVRPIL